MVVYLLLMGRALSKNMLIFVRHGRVDWNDQGLLCSTTDCLLNATGRTQAAQAAQVLSNTLSGKTVRLIASPRHRAVQTASAFVGDPMTPRKVKVDPNLVEFDFGDLEGSPSATATHGCAHALWQDNADGPPGGESWQSLSDRADLVIAHYQKYPDITMLFSHGYFVRAVAARFLAADVKSVCHMMVDNLHSIVLERSSNVWRLTGFNLSPEALADKLSKRS